jgi:hypothetical protein
VSERRNTTTGELRRLRRAIMAGAVVAQAGRDLGRSPEWAWHWRRRLGLRAVSALAPGPAWLVPHRAAVARQRLAATLSQLHSQENMPGQSLDVARFAAPASRFPATEKETPGTGPGVSLEFSM